MTINGNQFDKKKKNKKKKTSNRIDNWHRVTYISIINGGNTPDDVYNVVVVAVVFIFIKNRDL